eukprot:Skav236207  [mRNA]  locus=scaffold98:76671:78275:- [translate_table: standard]
MDHLVIIEKDKNCRRLLKRCYPHAYFFADVKEFKMANLKEMMSKIPGLTGVVVGGGSPCQGLSKLSSERRHLEDERSALFYEAARIFRDVHLVGEEQSLWVLSLLENVVGDASDVREMSRELGTWPVLVDSQYLSRARRPRLFWLSCGLAPVEGVGMFEKDLFTKVVYEAPTEPLSHFPKEGCEWEAGLRDEMARFPTFTLSIPRAQPPPAPVGLATADEGTRLRWVEDRHRYPPYTYALNNMVLTPEISLRPLCADEREILMGYDRGHTKKLWKKTPQSEKEKEEAEDCRCAAIGNAFHTNAVACLLDHALASMKLKKLKGAKAICEQSLKDQGSISEGDVPANTPTEEDNAGELQDDAVSVAGAIACEDASGPLGGSEADHAETRLASQLVSAYIRRQEYRGSDVRLDVGSLYRPDAWPRATLNPGKWRWHTAHSYPFHRQEHINILELRTIVHTLEWRLRSSHYGDCRSLHLSDSQVALAVAIKGRSSSRVLNRLLRRYAALQVAGGVHPLLAWIESELNPADAPSRRYGA